MASPSKLPTALQEIFTDQTHPVTTSTHPDPASPHPLDSLDALFNMEKVDSAEGSPTSRGTKRGRDEDDMADVDTPTQRRRFTRNPRIGSGFNIRPEDPVQIIDEEDAVNIGGEEGGRAPDVTLAVVPTSLFVSYNDSRIIPDSVCTLDTLAKLREDYKILDYITLSLPYQGYDVYTPPQDRLLIHKAVFECGVRLPFHPTLRRALVSLELAPL